MGTMTPGISYSSQKPGMILIILRVSICFSQNFGIKQLGMLLHRQYLKPGNVIDYSLGITRYVIFTHEMGHTFFLMIFSRSKYPDMLG